MTRFPGPLAAGRQPNSLPEYRHGRFRQRRAPDTITCEWPPKDFFGHSQKHPLHSQALRAALPATGKEKFHGTQTHRLYRANAGNRGTAAPPGSKTARGGAARAQPSRPPGEKLWRGRSRNFPARHHHRHPRRALARQPRTPTQQRRAGSGVGRARHGLLSAIQR